jgi:hypothetical protein
MALAPLLNYSFKPKRLPMKKIVATLLIGSLIMAFNSTQAQVKFQINIGSQPVWGPTGYDHVEYYYIPDIDAYYYVPRHQYVYWRGNHWVYAASLPGRYHDFDLYHSYKVVVNEPRPYLHHDADKVRYGKFRGRHDQAVIRDSRDQRYFVIKEHPEHERWRKDHEHDHDRDHDRH